MAAADGSAETTVLELALGRALRANALDASAEQQAVAAFRAAREAGTQEQARTRRRDDWQPRRTAARRSVKTAIGVFVGSLTLGGVAIAAIGSPGSGGGTQGGDPGRRHPSPTAPGSATRAPEGTAPSRPAGALSPSRPPTAKDIQAHCRAYPSVKGRGNALDSAAWQRFLAAAGGEDHVAAFCADRLSPAKTNAADSADGAGNTGNTGKETGKPRTGPADKDSGHGKAKGQRTPSK
ncbi:hypothetical protein ACWEO4_00020 [Streptomyces sp. NPDC004393]|uniref:hypothetical protein n=1 Tax=Streptomyces sp. NPDC004533 TaxID=3154278 RepID=UPI0033B75620